MENERTAKLPPQMIAAQVDQIVRSSTFLASPRLCDLLRYTTSQALAGHTTELKESVIGVEVFGRRPGYDSQSFSVVRVEFSRLRKKLDEYYRDQGRSDLVRVHYPRGTYVPVFRAAHIQQDRERQSKRVNHLAVLPFTHLGATAHDEYFAAGLTDELITAFGRVRDLRIVGRTSSFALAPCRSDAREVGRALNVDFVLEGSIRHQGERVRIHVQLLESAGGTQIWSERYERYLTDIFEVQDEIALSIVSALAPELPRIRQSLATSRTRSARAYELYLKGRYWWHRSNPAMCERAADLFREAIECDPDYAAPYSGLADALFNQALYGFAAPSSIRLQAEAAARRALELDGSSAEAHCSLGLVEGGLNWNTYRCEAELRNAIELNPSYALGLAKYGTTYLSPLGRFEEARAYILRGLELDPLSSNLQADLTLNLLYTGHIEAFIAEAHRVLEVDKTTFKLYPYLITALGGSGAWRAAVELADVACAAMGEQPYILAYTAWAYAGSGNMTQAVAIRDRLVTKSRTQYIPPSAIAATYLHSDTDKAFEYLSDACRVGEPLMRYAVWQSPALLPFRSDPRLLLLRQRVGL